MDSGLQNLRQELQNAIDGMPGADLCRHPAPGKWSVAEILEHLYLSYTGTAKGLEKMLERGNPLATKPSMRHRVRSLVVFGFNYLPSGRESPPAARPKGLPCDKVVAEFGEALAGMDALLLQGEMRLGRTTALLDHPIMGPFTATQWRKFHCIHGRHHLKQIVHLRQLILSGGRCGR